MIIRNVLIIFESLEQFGSIGIELTISDSRTFVFREAWLGSEDKFHYRNVWQDYEAMMPLSVTIYWSVKLKKHLFQVSDNS